MDRDLASEVARYDQSLLVQLEKNLEERESLLNEIRERVGCLDSLSAVLSREVGVPLVKARRPRKPRAPKPAVVTVAANEALPLEQPFDEPSDMPDIPEAFNRSSTRRA